MAQDTITELQLIDNLANSTVTQLRLVQGSDRRYRICVLLTWKEGYQTLETQRHTPRAWASLDRLIRHMESKYGRLPAVIQLELWSDDNDERTQGAKP